MRNIKMAVIGVFLIVVLTGAVTSVSATPPQPVVIHEGWTSFTNVNDIKDMDIEGDYLWCATGGGVVQWDKTDGTYVKYTIEHGLTDNKVISIAIDSNGVKWFGTYYNGVSRFDGETWKTYTEDNGLAGSAVFSIARDSDGVKWFGTSGGVSRFDDDTWTTYTKAEGLTSNFVNSIAIDNDGVKWFGTAGGLNRFDGETWTTYTTADGLVNDRVESIAIDSNGVKWFGTYYYGVSRYDGDTWTTYTTADGLAGKRVNSIVIDSNGVKWFGTSGGVSSFDDETWTTYTKSDGLADNFVYSIAIDSDGVKWIGTYRGGVSRFDDGTATFVESDKTPREITLGNHPNPFNPTTTITYTITEPGPVTLSIYNPAGQLVEELINERNPAGLHAFTWRTENLSSGLYFYQIEKKGYRGSGKMMLIK